MLLTVPAKEPAFPFCSLEAECETLMKSNLHLWMAMKRSALFATIEKPCPHTAGSKNLPTPPSTSTHPLPFTHRPPGTTFRLLWPVAIPLLCCVAMSTCWESFHQPSLGLFKAIQGHPPPPTLAHTHLKSGGDTAAENMCIHLKPKQFEETYRKI